LNHELDTIKKTILQRLDYCRNQLTSAQPGQSLANQSSVPDDSLISVTNQLKAKQFAYSRLLKTSQQNKKTADKSIRAAYRQIFGGTRNCLS
jgi:hypothetical protein